MNNQLITPTEYEALPVDRKDGYRQCPQGLYSDGWNEIPMQRYNRIIQGCDGYFATGVRLMYAPIIPIKENITVTRFTMSEDLILKKNDVVVAVFCDHELATEVINYLNRK